MTDHEWRLSGKDGCVDAFPADGGYFEQKSLVSIVRLTSGSGPNEEFFGPYDAFAAECGHVVPVAMLLAASTGQRCTSCTMLTEAGRDDFIPASAPGRVTLIGSIFGRFPPQAANGGSVELR